MKKENLKKNGSKYLDLTAYEAIAKVAKQEEDRHKEVQQAISIVKKILAIFGLKLEKRMILKDEKTGKKYY
jgi:hypothetical protein